MSQREEIPVENKEPTFEGFMRPVKNYFPMPNEWINICAEIDNLAELKIVQYVLRHTWGYHEFGITKHITVEEFMHGRKRQDGTRIDNGTGLKSDRSVKDAIKAAELHGYLISEVDKTDLARIKKSYALKMHFEPGQVDTTPLNDEIRQVVSTPLTGSIYPSEVQYLPLKQVVSTPRSEKDTLERHLEKDTLERQEGEGANAPTPAHLLKEVDEKLEEVEEVQRRITGEHPAIHTNETSYHIAESAIRKTEDEPTDPALPAVKIGASTHGQQMDNSHHPVSDHPDYHDRLHRTSDQTQTQAITSQQAPGAGMPLPLAADPPVGRHGDAAGVQAQPLSAPTPAQAEFPPAGSVASGVPTAQASGFKPPKRPSGKRPPAMPEPPKEITLTPQEKAFWSLWRGVWFNKDIPPNLTLTAYEHVKTLAPFITTEDDLKSLIIYARFDLQASSGVKRKAVQLGNLVNSYRGWKQEQSAQAPLSAEKPPMDKYTAASRNEERNERGLQRLRDMIIANGGELPK